MGLRKCCVGGCTATSETHRLFLIPKNDNLRDLWLSFLVPTNPLLSELSKSQLINMKVCSKHFDKQQFDEEGRRLRYSYPCLFSDLELALGEPHSRKEWNMLDEHNYFQKEGVINILDIKETADTSLEQPSCSFTRSYEVELFSEQSKNYGTKSTLEDPNPEWNMLDEHNYFQKEGVINILDIKETADTSLEQPSCSFTRSYEVELFSEQSKNYGTKSTLEDPNPEWNMLDEHNYFQKEGVINILDIKETADTSLEQPSCSFTRSYEAELFSEQSKNYGTKSTLEDPNPADTSLELPSCSFTRSYEEGMFSGQNKDYGTISVLEVQTPVPLKRKLTSKKSKLAKQIVEISAGSLENTVAENLKQAQCISNSAIIENFYALPKHARVFVEMQLKHVNTKKMARRFTMDEKLLSLALMKQSPKGYKLLEKILTLPNKRTLSRVSGHINFEPGLNPHVFEHIKRTVKNWDEKKKLCSVLYDEIALTPHITYDETKDEIFGFVDVNKHKKMAYCDHALVFMVRGICASWRQSIAYHFVQGTVSASELKIILKDVVFQVAQTGLTPLALISDQGSTFRTTIRSLRQDTIRSRNMKGLRDDGTVDVAGHQLNVFFDPPHLLKSIRNNFVNKDVQWEGKTASWQDILFIYDIDSKLGHTRTLPRLTAYHVDKTKIKKMKVSIAAQVLSSRAAAMLKFTHHVRRCPQSTMNTTGEFVEFVDKLFDSVNGYPGGAKKGKLRKAVKLGSGHTEFWSSAIKQLKLTKFIDKKSRVAVQSGQPRYIRVPSLDGWVTTLESFIRISKLLFEKYGVEYYYPRYINQDPLENFFGRLRALNYRHTNPNAASVLLMTFQQVKLWYLCDYLHKEASTQIYCLDSLI